MAFPTRLSPSVLFSAAALALITFVVASVSQLVAVELSSKKIWFLLSLSLGCGVGAGFSRLNAPRVGLLSALLFGGGAAQLWVTAPGWYQFIHLSPQGAGDLSMFALIALQGIVSAFALISVLTRDRVQETIRVFGGFKLLTLVALIAVFSVSIMWFIWQGDERGYLIHLVAASVFAGIGFLNVLAIVTSPDLPQLEIGPVWNERFSKYAPVALSLLVFFAALILSRLAFGGIPIVEDETAYLLQARTFAGGAMMAPPLPEGTASAFEFYLMESNEGAWYSVTAPGWPAVLAIGVLLGVPSLINPVLGGASVWLGYSFWKRVSGQEQATFVVLLMAMSPWLIGVSASYMTHALCLVLTLGAWLLIAIVRDRAKQALAGITVIAFAAGLCMGGVFVTRALEGILLGGFTGLWMLWHFGRQKRFTPIVAYGFGCIAIGVLLFAYNMQFTGAPLATPQAAYLADTWGEGANAFGFGKDIGPPSGWGALDLWHGHTFVEGLINTANGLTSLNLELLGWTCGSLLLIWCYMLWARPKQPDRLMLIIAVTIVVVHLFYWFTGTFYVGPRYWFGAFFAFIVLSAAGAVSLVERLSLLQTSVPQRRIMVAVLVCSLFGLTVFTSWRSVEKYSQRNLTGRVMDAYQLPELPREATDGAIVFLACQDLVDAAMFRNDPYMRAGHTIFALDRGPDGNDTLLKAFPRRAPIYATSLSGECSK